MKLPPELLGKCIMLEVITKLDYFELVSTNLGEIFLLWIIARAVRHLFGMQINAEFVYGNLKSLAVYILVISTVLIPEVLYEIPNPKR